MAALRLVQQQKLSLDADINACLTSWKLPSAPVAKETPVTLRELLTHTAGITVHGFPGYAADAPVRTLVQVLNGEKPANTPAIRIETQPGAKWKYSGGGITIMQQCLIDVTKTPFPKLLHDTVLDPLGMTYSTYDQPLPADLLRSAATPYLANYKPVPGGPHIYPELAAAGLRSTPSDLARYAIEIQRGLQGKSNRVLSQDMIRQMLTSGMGNWGLGIQIGGAPSNPFFTHGGVDEGFESLLVAYENTGEGAVVMTNARGGTALAEEIIRSIAVEYGWPDHQPTVRTAVSVDPKLLAGYAGTYEIGPNFDLVVTVEDGRLVTQATNQPKFPLLAESDTKFFPIAFEAQLEFVKDDQGKVTHVILHQNGRDTKAPRK